jgi:hypothetical protein
VSVVAEPKTEAYTEWHTWSIPHKATPQLTRLPVCVVCNLHTEPEDPALIMVKQQFAERSEIDNAVLCTGK